MNHTALYIALLCCLGVFFQANAEWAKGAKKTFTQAIEYEKAK